jgi:hypothetical protein
VAPTGWESFTTTAALVGIDQVAAALRRKKSEKSSVKKGGAPNTNLKTRHPYELLSGIHPDADNEAMKILQSNRYLTNAFLRLYNHAYHLESETAKLELRIKLNNLLKKEIEYRKKLLNSIHQEGIKQLIESSINNLIELGTHGIIGIERFLTYYESMRAVQPNNNNSSINKTLANINKIYSN